jgi:hypothetical protein
MGTAFHMEIGPDDPNCPKESSMKYRGMPAIANMMAYGMRKVAGTQNNWFIMI